MSSFYQSIFVELWPLWAVMAVSLLYLLILEIRQYKKLTNEFNDLKEWVGLFSYKDGRGEYSDLKGKIKRYIQEELEKERESQPANSPDKSG